MGIQRFLSIGLLLTLWMASVMSDAGRKGLQAYLPQETFIIHDVNFNSHVTPQRPMSSPLLQAGASSQRSSIPGLSSQQQSVQSSQQHPALPSQQHPALPSQQQSISPQRSFQPSSSIQQQATIPQRKPAITAEVPQRQINSSPQVSFMATTNSNQQRTSQPQLGFASQIHTVLSNSPQQQSTLTQQRPSIPANTFQQQLDFTTQKPTAPSPVHSNAPHGSWRPIPTTRQPTRIPQSPGNFQHPSATQQTNHRFSSTVRPIESQSPPAPQYIIPQPHHMFVESGYRQSPEPQENTIRRPSNRHHLCGVFPPSGECRAAFPRYYYNNQTDQCDCFLYGGCGAQGLKYSYLTLEECHSTCSPSKKEEGPTCKEIYKEDEVFLDSQTHNVPQPLSPHYQNLPVSTPPSNQRYRPIPADTSHVPDKQLIILLVNAANQEKREAHNNNSSPNNRGHQ